QSDRPFHGLWSLWDIMRFFPATLLTSTIGNIDRHYENFAERVDKHKWSATNLISVDDREAFKRVYAPIGEYCVDLELTGAAATIEKMLRCLKDANAKYGDFFAFGPEFSGRFKDEMQSRIVLALSLVEGKLVLSPREGWQEIIGRFPDCATDIEEAQYCYALQRYAGAVFHSLQVVEIGLIELGRVIVATDPQTGWNATTKRLEAILKTKYPDRTPFQQQHQKFLEQIAATIELLKSAWRNKVSHAQDKLVLLRTDFTPAIAEEILIATRSFMRRLADECPSAPDADA